MKLNNNKLTFKLSSTFSKKEKKDQINKLTKKEVKQVKPKLERLGVLCAQEYSETIALTHTDEVSPDNIDSIIAKINQLASDIDFCTKRIKAVIELLEALRVRSLFMRYLYLFLNSLIQVFDSLFKNIELKYIKYIQKLRASPPGFLLRQQVGSNSI